MKYPVQICLIACFLWSGYLHAQSTVLSVNPSFDAQKMADVFASSPCINITNPSLSGSPNASGGFLNAGPSIGFEAGIILTTGNATNAIGPNTTPSAGSVMDSLHFTDADMQQLVPGNAILRDLAVFEFDFVPTKSEIQFRYVFASEEYCEFASSGFNDVLGLFLSGPGISGSFTNNAVNLAMLPNGVPVYISNVSHLENTDYYISNIPPGQPNCSGNPLGDPEATENCQYDAFTIILTATAQVIPFEQYHLRIAIADVGDPIYDSAVFLEAGSFDSGETPLAQFAAHGVSYDVSFLNQSFGAADYVWDFGDGNTSTEENPTHIYDEIGTYTVTLTAADTCGGTDVFTQEIIIGLPEADFEANSTQVCPQVAVSFSNLSSPNSADYAWHFPGGTPSSSSEANPVVVYDVPGLYPVMLISSNPLGMDTLILDDYIEVLDPGLVDFDVDVAVDKVQFSSMSSGALSYQWNFGNGQSSTEENPSHTYTQAGVFNVTLTITTQCGSYSLTQPVFIEAVLPQAAFGASATTGCVPLEVQFSDNSNNQPASWAWQFPGGEPATSGEQNPVVVYETPGTYSVTLNVSNVAGSSELVQSQFITVGDVPDVQFSQEALSEAGVQFINNTPGANSYLWDFGDGSTSQATNPTHTYTASGNYTVTLVASNACGSSSFTQVLQIVLTSASELAFAEYFNLYPNPSDGLFHIELRGQPIAGVPVQFSLYDVLGRRLWLHEADFSSGELRETVQLQQLAGGMYFLEVRAGNQAFQRRLIIR
jgi:PKD repeat protein